MKTPLTSGQRTALEGLLFVLMVLLVSAWGFFMTGCQMPQWRVFQAKVPAVLVEKPKAQAEGERQAAAYIARVTAPPVTDPARVVGHIHPVATALSSSLGEPLQAIQGDDPAKTVAALRMGLKAKEQQLEAWKAFGRKHAGKELEATGINLAGPAGLTALLAVIAACVFIPGFGWVVLRVVPLLLGAIRQMAAGVESFAKDAPQAASQLKTDYLGRKMDRTHKRIVARVKKSIAPKELEPSPASP